MSNIFKITGLIAFIVAFMGFLVLLGVNVMQAILVLFFGIVGGFALLELGTLRDRVKYLEDKLDIHMPVQHVQEKQTHKLGSHNDKK